MNGNCTERRAALIAALIAIPAAILISMLVHFFAGTPVAPVFAKKAPAMPPQMGGMKGGPRMGAPMMGEREDLTPIYKKRAELAEVILKHGQQQFKEGSLAAFDLIPLEVNCRLAEGALFRYTNKIRTRGVSLSDIAVKYDGACRQVKNLKKQYEAGGVSLIAVSKITDNMLELEIQLKSNRNYQNEAWQSCYDAYRQNPNDKNYLAMLEAEREFPAFRRF